MKTIYSAILIDEIRQKTDIASIISEDVVLRKTGKNFIGLCPFHAEHTPSFSVSPEKQIYYCFGCGAGGNVYSFLMKRRGLTFPEAVRELAGRAGVSLPEAPQSAEEMARQKEKELIYQMNEAAAQYFTGLLASRLGAGTRAYIQQRGITGESGSEFRLGYAAPTWDGLAKSMTAQGYAPEMLAKAGLLVSRAEGNGYYDRFRDRLIFPICDSLGRVIGFGGRVIGEGTPKYLNSPETPVFEKGRHLYGLNLTKAVIRQSNQAVIVEGYLDVITAYQSGVKNIVASLGTALTAEQGRLLHQYGQDIVIAYDADAAGQAATLRGMETLAEIGCRVRIATLPPGEDPDTLVRSQGKEGLVRLVEDALILTDYKLKSILAAGNRSSIEGRTNIIKQAVPILSALDSSSERELYIKSLARKLEVTEEAIRADIRRYSEKPDRGQLRDKDKETKTTYNRSVAAPGSRPPGRTPLVPAHFQSERMLLKLMPDNQMVLDKVREELGADGFSDPSHRIIAGVILSLAETGTRILPAQVLAHLPEGSTEAEQAAVEIFMQESLLPEGEKAVADYTRAVKEHRIDQKLSSLLEQIRLLESQGDSAQTRDLLEQCQALRSAKRR